MTPVLRLGPAPVLSFQLRFSVEAERLSSIPATPDLFAVAVLTDADSDGLPDFWEKYGAYDFNLDGDVDPEDVYLDGADWQRKDVFVEIDYMEDSTHTDGPSPGRRQLRRHQERLL
jgi:hypothetical protein